jgi:hypothetical protein
MLSINRQPDIRSAARFGALSNTMDDMMISTQMEGTINSLMILIIINFTHSKLDNRSNLFVIIINEKYEFECRKVSVGRHKKTIFPPGRERPYSLSAAGLVYL